MLHDRLMLDPWHIVKGRPEIVIHHVRLPHGMHGATSGNDIYLSKALTQRQRRCVLMHELVHWQMGHDGHQHDRIEARVDRIAAEALIELADLRDALRWGRDEWEVAEHLCVTQTMLTVRMEHLDRGDWEWLRAA